MILDTKIYIYFNVFADPLKIFTRFHQQKKHVKVLGGPSVKSIQKMVQKFKSSTSSLLLIIDLISSSNCHYYSQLWSRLYVASNTCDYCWCLCCASENYFAYLHAG